MEIPIKKNDEVAAMFGPKAAQPARPSRFNPGQPAKRPLSQPQKYPSPRFQPPTKALQMIDRVVQACIYLTAFLIPLFFLPFVPSVLELNKQMVLVAVVGIGFLAWVGKMAWRNEIRIKKHFILVPIVTLLLILGLSTAFSMYVDQSLWGYFGGESDAFITWMFFVALFFLITNNIQTRKRAIALILTFIGSGLLATIYGALQLFDVYILSLPSTQNPFFNTVGTVYVFAVYVAVNLLFTVALFLEEVPKLLKGILIVLSVFFFFVLMLVNFKVVWIGLIISLALLLGSVIVRSTQGRNGVARILPMVFLVLSLLMLLQKNAIIKRNLPVEVLLSYSTSARITLNSFKSNPLLGVGPTHYASVYEKNRPSGLGDFWSVSFNNATSYFFTLASTVGILGTLAFLFLVGTGLVYLFRGMAHLLGQSRQPDFMIIGAGVVWLFITIVLFAYLANVTILLMWWLSFALFLSFIMFDLSTNIQEFVTSSQTPRSSLVMSFVFVLVIIGFITAIYLQTQKYVAAVVFNRAIVADAQGEKVEVVAERLARAINIDPNRDIYYRNLSVALFALANQKVAEKGKDLTPEDSAQVSQNIKGAIQSAGQALAINPKDPENYVGLANVFEGVLATMDQADKRAIENYEKAIELDPSNPVLHQKIANIYVILSDIEAAKSQQKNQAATELPEESKKYLASAMEELNKALAIKFDYADANLLQTSILEREGKLDQAIESEKKNKAQFPRVPGIAFRLGLLYYKNNQLDDARGEFQYAVTLDEKYSNARYFLGIILDKQKDKPGALSQFEKIAELNPDNENVKKIIENLKNGKEALAGLSPQAQQSPDTAPSSAPPSAQPTINPPVETQEIPQQATPRPEDLAPAQ